MDLVDRASCGDRTSLLNDGLFLFLILILFRSTHNTRIERLWVEVGTQFVRRWRGFFSRLERLHQLDVDKPEHLWLLHTLFLDAINVDCVEFRTNWNNHPMARHETYDKSPNVR